jgi:CHRD domain-containing protein
MRLRLIVFTAILAVLVPALALAASSSSSGTVTAKLSGKVEVPKGDPDGTGTATIRLNASTGKVCWTFKFSNIAKPNASHIHEGKAGKAGPVVIPLGKAFKAKGCTTVTGKAKREVRDTIEKPGDYYVNIHNAKYPGGAVRGQLKRAAKS